MCVHRIHFRNEAHHTCQNPTHPSSRLTSAVSRKHPRWSQLSLRELPWLLHVVNIDTWAAGDDAHIQPIKMFQEFREKKINEWLKIVQQNKLEKKRLFFTERTIFNRLLKNDFLLNEQFFFKLLILLNEQLISLNEQFYWTIV